MLHNPNRSIHFVGVGGIGMSGLAEILLTFGYSVSGSDLQASEITRRLEELGLHFAEGHDAQHVSKADAIVVSAAVPESNPELAAARTAGIPVMHRSDLLADIIRMKPNAVVVGGTHGKTTTTSMISAMLDGADFDATSVVGGILQRSGTNAAWGAGDYIVAEADEHDGSFLRLHPTIAVVTNVDAEHLEYYGTVLQLQHAFVEFCNSVPFYGWSVLCADDTNTLAILPELHTSCATYGYSEDATIRAVNVETVCAPSGALDLDAMTTRFAVHNADARLGATGELGVVELRSIGRHNVQNALAACTVGLCLGIPFARIAAGLATYSGVHRRMQVCGAARGVTVVEDYAHHPTELSATLQAVRESNPARVLAVFQPHLYSRTKYLFNEFAAVLSRFDEVLVTDIYPSREEPIAGVSSALIVDAAKSESVRLVPDPQDAAAAIAASARDGDIVLILGAGDINRIARPVLDAIGRS